MSSLYQEIQHVSDHPDKCINYPIGDRLLSALSQENRESPNFVLSGVLIFAAAKIFGRKVDSLEQEILGVARNFEQIDSASAKEGDGEQQQPQDKAKEVKKSRTRKYAIKDGVSLEKSTFEEIEIKVAAKNDINKLLAVPSRLSRLQKMKEFFAKNKAKSGKLAIPKSMLLLNDTSLVSNFGGTLIHDYDDNKDIVGSRKDFSSFSHYINSSTGELESDLNFSSKQQRNVDDVFFPPEHLNTNDLLSNHSPFNPPRELTPPPTPTSPPLTPAHSGKASPCELNISIDEGIDLDQLSEHNHLLSPIQPVIKLCDFLRQSPSLFPDMMQMNQPIDMTFSTSILTVMERLKETSEDFVLPEKFKADAMEVRMKNIFMVPLNKLKHRCLFDLPPDEEFRELKRRKVEQFKPITQALDPTANKRLFKLLDMEKPQAIIDNDHENAPFLGFTKDEQNESLFHIPNNRTYSNESTTHNTTLHPLTVSTAIDIAENSSINDSQISLRKKSNDSGFDSEYINTTNECSSINDESGACRLDNSSNEENSNKDGSSACEPNINISGADSCIGSSLVSGNSGEDAKNEAIPSFLDEFSVGNGDGATNEEEHELGLSQENQSLLESEERVRQMRQSAINVIEWKKFLKPILAESEKRSKIDMHEFGLAVIRKIGTVGETKNFGEIVEEGKTPAFFLTMLQLTNNRNIELNFGKRSITQPTSLDDIRLTLKSQVVHREKFDEMGQQFQQEAENKKLNVLKRKAENTKNTSTPAKRSFINDSLNFDTPDQSIINNRARHSMCMQLSQASSGYFSQNSTLSELE